jgi:hypothetical protein
MPTREELFGRFGPVEDLEIENQLLGGASPA